MVLKGKNTNRQCCLKSYSKGENALKCGYFLQTYDDKKRYDFMPQSNIFSKTTVVP